MQRISRRLDMAFVQLGRAVQVQVGAHLVHRRHGPKEAVSPVLRTHPRKRLDILDAVSSISSRASASAMAEGRCCTNKQTIFQYTSLSNSVAAARFKPARAGRGHHRQARPVSPRPAGDEAIAKLVRLAQIGKKARRHLLCVLAKGKRFARTQFSQSASCT
jgi:hypothetical protein